MLDIELVAQTAALLAGTQDREVLAQLTTGQGIGWIRADELEKMRSTYIRLRRIQQIGRLLVEGPLVPDNLGAGGCALLLGENKSDNLEQLKSDLTTSSDTTNPLIDTLFGRLPA